MKKNLFVYGTLMNGEAAASKTKGAEYIGNYRLPDYAMYRVASYPGIVEKTGETVVGELYEIEEEMLPGFDSYEGEGYLYIRKEVTVYNEADVKTAYAYIYNQPVRGELMREAWNAKDTDYVWYAAYGSNLSRERFSNYIEGGVYRLTGKYCDGCCDKSKWIGEKERRYPGEMYYGNSSGTWENGGVAFFDRYGTKSVPMRLYKITREQLHEIHGHEGKSERWYGKLLCLDILADGCPVYTLTSETRRPANEPCRKYRDLIENEIKKMEV